MCVSGCYGQFARRKAAELEVFHSGGGGVEPSGGGGAEGEPSAKRRRVEDEGKRRREDVREGEDLIEQFLSSVRALPLGELSEEEVRAKLEGLKVEVLGSNNPYIQAIVESCTSSTQ